MIDVDESKCDRGDVTVTNYVLMGDSTEDDSTAVDQVDHAPLGFNRSVSA